MSCREEELLRCDVEDWREMRCGRLERDADENEDRIGRVSNGIYTEMIPRDGTQAE